MNVTDPCNLGLARVFSSRPLYGYGSSTRAFSCLPYNIDSYLWLFSYEYIR